MSKRLDPTDYHALAERHGFKWLGPVVLGTHVKTAWECSAGHVWETVYHKIKDGRGCPFCSGSKIHPQQYMAVANGIGLVWLGPEVATTKRKTGWRCSEGHTWEISYQGLIRGRGCPTCYAIASSHGRESYLRLATEVGIAWLGTEVPENTKTRTSWRCPKGHEWETTYASLRSSTGNGCPTCKLAVLSRKFRHGPEKYRKLAEEKGFVWLGPPVKNCGIRTKWQCSKGHVWENSYRRIYEGIGCLVCHESRGESAVAEALDRLGIRYDREVAFEGCRSKRGKLLRFDFFVSLPSGPVLIEYDGIQHFQPIDGFGGKRGYRAMVENDAIKNRYCEEQETPLLRIPYTDFERVDEVVRAWVEQHTSE